jgi:hypothetical protein
MDLFRKIGIGIATMIPGFVLAGLVWDWFGSWLVVLGLEIVIVFVYVSIITGKFSSPQST